MNALLPSEVQVCNKAMCNAVVESLGVFLKQAAMLDWNRGGHKWLQTIVQKCHCRHQCLLPEEHQLPQRKSKPLICRGAGQSQYTIPSNWTLYTKLLLRSRWHWQKAEFPCRGKGKGENNCFGQMGVYYKAQPSICTGKSSYHHLSNITLNSFSTCTTPTTVALEPLLFQ